jgi:coenzyme F420-reducing hydrogenase alpha subunit
MTTVSARAIETALRGRPFTVPTALLAGIDGHDRTAYRVCACRAVEAALRVDAPDQVEALRRLLCCAAWIKGHATHIHLVQAPDLLGHADAAETARLHRTAVARGVEIHHTGAALAAAIGESVLQPAAPHRGPLRASTDLAALAGLRPRLDDAVEAALRTVRWVAGFDIPTSVLDIPLIALDDPGPESAAGGLARYPIDVGVGVLVSNGLGFPLGDFESFVSRPRSGSMRTGRAALRGAKATLTGPLARYALCGARLHPAARSAAQQAGLVPGERNPYRSALIRAVELVHALEEAATLIDGYPTTGMSPPAVSPRPGRGVAAAETPAGLVYQRYDLLADGTVGAARVVGPHELNRTAIELDLRRAEREARRRDPSIDPARLDTLRAELTDNYEPCVSGSFPALDRPPSTRSQP